jgi:hypothetical protein
LCEFYFRPDTKRRPVCVCEKLFRMERVERKDLSGFVVGVDGGCSSRSAVYFFFSIFIFEYLSRLLRNGL